LLANTAHGVEPFWSPDGSAIGFFAEGKLKVLDVAGGTVRNLWDAPNDSSGTWSASGLMLFAPGQDGSVSAVSGGDGVARPVTRLDHAAGDLRHSRPRWLQDGRHFVYLADRRDGQTAMLASIDGPSTQPLGPVQSHVQPTRTQHVLYVRDGNLLAQRLDVQAGRLTGETTILAEGLAVPGRSFGGGSRPAPICSST
jgi:Tol biopolymer transport system component